MKCWEAIGQLCCVLCFDGILRIVGFLLAAAPGFFSPVPCHMMQTQFRGRVLPYVTLRVELDGWVLSTKDLDVKL